MAQLEVGKSELSMISRFLVGRLALGMNPDCPS